MDVLAWKSRCPEEVLLIEAKAILAPDEVNEIDDATQKIAYGQKQMERAIRIMESLPTERKAQLFRFVEWPKVRRYWGVVVTAEGNPHALLEQHRIPTISLFTLQTRLRSCDMSCPRRVWEACVKRPWLQRDVPGAKYGHKAIKMGDITYRLPTKESP